MILEYFDVNFKMVNDIPKIKLTLKESKKITDKPLLRQSGKPVSGSELGYYINYLGDSVGRKVYNERRKLFSKNKLVQWYIDTFKPDNKKELEEYILSIGRKVSDSLKEHYSGPAGKLTKEKYKERAKIHAKRIGKINSEKWKDMEWRETQIQRRRESGMYERNSILSKKRMSDPIFKKKFIKACNSPERIRKISESAKQMWADAKKYDKAKYNRMLLSQKNKNFIYNGYNMNSIEYEVAQIISEISDNWVYENVIHVKDNSYVPDFIINENIIIECFGDFWHANPLYFKPSDTTHKSRCAVDIWKYDNEKIKNLESAGYKVLVLWETDILNSIDNCKQLINEIV